MGGGRHGGLVARLEDTAEPVDAEEPDDTESPLGAASQLPEHGQLVGRIVVDDVLALRRLTDRAPAASIPGAAGLTLTLYPLRVTPDGALVPIFSKSNGFACSLVL